MRFYITFVALFIISYSDAQQLDSLGIKHNTLLNIHEAQFLNIQLSPNYDNYDFSNKLVACFYYTDDFYPRTKIEFFAEAKNFYLQGKALKDQVIILTEKERRKYEGFDVIIVSGYNKSIDEKTRKSIVKKLKKMVLNLYYGEDYYFLD